MNLRTTHNTFPFFLAALLLSCSSEEGKVKNLPTQKEVNRGMEEINRAFVQDESAQIDAFIERRNWPAFKSSTGLRVYIYQEGSGDSAYFGDVAEIKYKLSLLNGTAVDSTAPGETASFLIGQDNVESGLHEGITYMNEGSRAKLILPTYLAHGLIGDLRQIPPRSTIVYDVELVKVK